VPAFPSPSLSLVTRHLRQTLPRARDLLTDGAVADGEARFWGQLGSPIDASRPARNGRED
jgi:hypothetical protein